MSAKETSEKDAVESIIDDTAYPGLTHQVPSAGSGQSPFSSLGSLAPVATNALREILGWNPTSSDPKGFSNALLQSFELNDVEGHIQFKWTPRSYAVQTDLSGGISGPQASIYTRTQKAIVESNVLLDRLRALDSTADPEDVDALRAVIRGLMKQLVDELGKPGGPRVQRIDQVFELLLGINHDEERLRNLRVPMSEDDILTFDMVRFRSTGPNEIGGELGTLREAMGLSDKNDFVNTMPEEQCLTDFRILADYLIGLRQSWIENRSYFTRGKNSHPFFGTQLVLLSRQLSVIAGSVIDVGEMLESVFISQLERQTLEIVPVHFQGDNDEDLILSDDDFNARLATSTPIRDQPIFLEDLLQWILTVAQTEAPELIRTGGKLAVKRVLFKLARKLERLMEGARHPYNRKDIPEGYFTPRVKRAMRELHLQLVELKALCKPIDHEVTTVERDGVVAAHPAVETTQVTISRKSRSGAQRRRRG